MFEFEKVVHDRERLYGLDNIYMLGQYVGNFEWGVYASTGVGWLRTTNLSGKVIEDTVDLEAYASLSFKERRNIVLRLISSSFTRNPCPMTL